MVKNEPIAIIFVKKVKIFPIFQNVVNDRYSKTYYRPIPIIGQNDRYYRPIISAIIGRFWSWFDAKLVISFAET